MPDCEESYGFFPWYASPAATEHSSATHTVDVLLSTDIVSPRSSSSLGGSILLCIAYGYVLLKGAQLLSDGSEMLLEVLNPGVIGGVGTKACYCMLC